MPGKTPLRAERRGTAADTTRLVLSGDLDYDTAPELLAFGRESLSGRVGELELDLSGVTFVDSSGLAALIDLYRRAGEGVRIVALTPYLRHLFRVTALDRFFRLPTQ